jgi:hypothetical protein
MTSKQLLFRSAAREKLVRGATQLSDAIRSTRGLERAHNDESIGELVAQATMSERPQQKYDGSQPLDSES